MAYVPPHKRHLEVSDGPSPTPYLLVHELEKTLNFKSSHSSPGSRKDRLTSQGEKDILESDERDIISSTNQDNFDFRRKLLVLDLNGLLVHVERKSYQNNCFKRPFCDDFLKFCFERFNVGVWSSRTEKKAKEVVDIVMGDMKNRLLFIWNGSHCTQTGLGTIDNKHKPLVLKELRKLWDNHENILPWEKGIYNESNTLLLDDSPYKALRNPLHTAIFPATYTRGDIDDNSLGVGGDLRVYLDGLVVAENVQKYVEENPFGQPAITNTDPSWEFYRRVIGTI